MITALVMVVVVAAFFSAGDAALVSMGREWLEEESKRGLGWARVLRRVGLEGGSFQRIALVANSMLASASAVLTTLVVTRHAEPPVGALRVLVALAAGVLGFLVAGSLGPRLVALRHPVTVARWLLPPLTGLYLIFWAVSLGLGWLLRPLVRVGGGASVEAVPPVTEEEIKRVITEGSEAGVLAEEESEMLHSVIEFNDTIAREVMVPRLDIVALEANATPSEILRVALEEGYSRVPVYQGTLDNITGIVHIKDLLRVWEHRDLIVLFDIMRKPHFIPETKKLSELLREFRTRNSHMAIVVDEFGATEGLVTLEDVIEEIVGEIRDEHDMEEPDFIHVADGEFVVKGGMNLEDFASELDMEPPVTEVDTVGGFVIELVGRIPRPGETAEHGGWRFEVVAVEKSRLRKVRVTRQPAGGAAGAAPDHESGGDVRAPEETPGRH